MPNLRDPAAVRRRTLASWLVRFVAAGLVLAGCAGTARTEAGSFPAWEPSRTVILVSLDGFGADYLDRFQPETLTSVAESGVRAAGLVPVFPTKTFPSHYSIATGLYPTHHGIVSNNMYDPPSDAYFRMGDRDAAVDTAWWGGEPIWVTAERQGRIAATYFWPGSESPVGGIRPTYWKRYDESTPGSERVRQALRWLDLPSQRRPSFISLYFSEVDAAGHSFGPEDPRTGAAVDTVDRFVGELIAGLKDRGLWESVNLLIVSDHGMVARSAGQVIFLDDFINLEDVEIIEWSPVLALRPTGVSVDSLYSLLHGAHPRLAVYRREAVPSRLRYSGNPRIMPIIGIADEGWSVARREGFDPDRYTGGMHGHDNRLPSMHGIFLAHGPAFAPHARVPAVESIHLYELMADILGITPASNDGSLSATAMTRRGAVTKRSNS